MWSLESTGLFSTKSAYAFLVGKGGSVQMQSKGTKSVMETQSTKKGVGFYMDRVPTRGNLLKRGVMSSHQKAGVTVVLPVSFLDHFSQHRGMFKGKERKNRAGIIWLTVVWTIWIERNAIIIRMLDLIKSRSCNWYHSLLGGKASFSDWCINPLDYSQV